MHSNSIGCTTRLAAATVLIFGFVFGNCSARAQDAVSKPGYLNPAVPTEQRVADLISRMTLEEKASQLVNQSRAIPRLRVPAYDWWSESLHGVAVNGTTEFHQGRTGFRLAAASHTPLRRLLRLHSPSAVRRIFPIS